MAAGDRWKFTKRAVQTRRVWPGLSRAVSAWEAAEGGSRPSPLDSSQEAVAPAPDGTIHHLRITTFERRREHLSSASLCHCQPAHPTVNDPPASLTTLTTVPLHTDSDHTLFVSLPILSTPLARCETREPKASLFSDDAFAPSRQPTRACLLRPPSYLPRPTARRPVAAIRPTLASPSSP